MKTFYLFIIIIFLCLLYARYSCSNPVQVKKFNHDEYVRKELASGKHYNNLFLDFSFGMTREQSYNKANELIDEKILKPDAAIRYTYKYFSMGYIFRGYPYDFNFGNYAGHALVLPVFDNDSLSALEILIFGFTKRKDVYLVTQDFRKFLGKMYGPGKSEEISNANLPTYWVNGNREITLKYCSFGFIITFKNLLTFYEKKYPDLLERSFVN